ncbi:MAG: hypothetical protein ACJ735_12755 [Actinomycetes bacterium]
MKTVFISAMYLASECTQHCSFVHDYIGLMTDAPHWAFELSLEAITGLAVYPFAKRLLRAYRERIHREIDEEHGVVHHD